MKCAFCGYNFGDTNPASCPRCQAGLDGLTEGQMNRITHDLKNADRGGMIDALLGSLMIAMAIIFGLHHWGLPFVVGFSVLAVILWVLAIMEVQKAADLRWMLTWWGKQKQATKPEAKERETKEIDSIEAIRKLAELRDQGILTQEEFEQKKKKLL
jgi:hypothetical protein